jgi:hypothetical protein
MKIFFSLLLIANIAFGLMQWLLPYDQLFQKNKKFPVAEELRLLDLCYTIGPFKDRTRALEVSRRYTNRKVKTELKSSLEKEYLGVMVYLTGNKSRQDAIDTAEELATKGFRDYLIINEPGKSNALSLGVFGLKKNADRHVTRLKKLNYPAKSEPRYRERTIYWVYNEQSMDRDLLTLLDADDAANGIGQIPQQCS